MAPSMRCLTRETRQANRARLRMESPTIAGFFTNFVNSQNNFPIALSIRPCIRPIALRRAGKRKDMARTQTETIGFADKVLSMLEEHAEALRQGGLDVEKVIAALKMLLREAIEADSEQESCKRRALEATDRLKKANRALDTSASSILDMAMGSVNKSSDTARVMARLRSDMRRPRRGESQTDSTDAVSTV